MLTRKTIWVIEDDPSAVFIYEDILKLRYNIKVFQDLKTFITELMSTKNLPDLLISDLKLGDENFLDFLTSDDSIDYLKLPFIVVSGIDDIDILRLCFDEGAIDYLTKPFIKSELLVKIERLLNKIASPATPLGSFDEADIILDPYSNTLKRLPDKVVSLTGKELQIYSLLSLAYKNGEAINRVKFVSELWGDAEISSKSLDVHLFHLRKKLHFLGIRLSFKDGKGYFLNFPKDTQDGK